MRLNKTLSKYPYVMYNPAEHTYKGYFGMWQMIEDYEQLYKSKHWVNGVMFFEKGKEIKL